MRWTPADCTAMPGRVQAALKRIAQGFQFVTVGSDARLMAAGSQQVLAALCEGRR